MKILTMHSDFIEFEPLTKALKTAEEVEMGKRRMENCLVAFTAVEKSDEENVSAAAENTVSEIMNVAAQVKVNSVVVYPWVHLSSSPSSPNAALDALKQIESGLKQKGFIVERAPFGWYKEFNVKCKGHPLAELSRNIGFELVAGEPNKRMMITLNGEIAELEKEGDAFKLSQMKAADRKALAKARVLSDYSQYGSWFPKGMLVKTLLMRKAAEAFASSGAVESVISKQKQNEISGLQKVFWIADAPRMRALLEGEEAKNEFVSQIENVMDWWNSLGVGCEMKLLCSEQFLENEAKMCTEIQAKCGKKILMEVFDSLPFDARLDFVHVREGTVNVSGITLSAFGEKKEVLVSLGAVESTIDLLLASNGRNALPVWLSPTQVRVIPATKEFGEFASEVAEQLELSGMRVDVDDREEPIEGLVAFAEKEWIPFVLVVGEKEKESKKFSVKARGNGEMNASIEELIVAIRKKIEMMPFERLPLPRQMSKRPVI